MAQTTIQGSFLGTDLISAQTPLTTGLATTDELIVSDAGVIKRMDISVLEIAATQITASGTLPALNGAALTALSAANITASGTLPALSGVNLTALVAGNITAGGTFLAQNGSALTALNATQLTSGTIPAARIGDDSIVEAKLDVSNAPSNGQFLQAQSGEGGGLTWAAAGGGTTVNGTTDNAILTYINSSGEFTAESELKYNGAGNLYYSRAGTVQFDMVPTGGSSQAWALSARTDGTFRITNDTDGSIDFQIDGDGAITTARQPLVIAFNSSTDSNVTGNGATATVDFDTELADQNGDFVSDTFHAPVTGPYLVQATIMAGGFTDGNRPRELTFVTSNREWSSNTINGASGESTTAMSSTLIDMDASDTLTVTYRVRDESSNVIDILGDSPNTRTYLSVRLV